MCLVFCLTDYSKYLGNSSAQYALAFLLTAGFLLILGSAKKITQNIV